MVDRKFIPFLSERENEELLTLMGRGHQTVQEFQDPKEPLTFQRFNDETEEWEPRLANVLPIKIALVQRQALGLEAKNEIRKSGVLRLWIQDFDVDPVHAGDRFWWQEQLCVVELINEKRLHRIDIDFLLVNENLS